MRKPTITITAEKIFAVFTILIWLTTLVVCFIRGITDVPVSVYAAAVFGTIIYPLHVINKDIWP